MGEGDVHMQRPTVGSILLRSLPSFAREGFLPVAAFYVAWKAAGLAAGMAAAAAVALAVYAFERRAGRDGLLVRLSLGFVAVQTLVGAVSDSATAYLATPVIGNAAWGVLMLGSAAIRRPLAGVIASAWYPFPPEFRESALFKRVYGIESVVWGAYFLARSALRLGVLLGVGIGAYVAVAFVTGTPMMVGLLVWSIWYAIRRFSDVDVDDDEPEPPDLARQSATTRERNAPAGGSSPP
jgi:Protein of unknown function (DUF3159)